MAAGEVADRPRGSRRRCPRSGTARARRGGRRGRRARRSARRSARARRRAPARARRRGRARRRASARPRAGGRGASGQGAGSAGASPRRGSWRVSGHRGDRAYRAGVDYGGRGRTPHGWRPPGPLPASAPPPGERGPTMKAAVVHGFDAPLAIEDVPVPEPVAIPWLLVFRMARTPAAAVTARRPRPGPEAPVHAPWPSIRPAACSRSTSRRSTRRSSSRSSARSGWRGSRPRPTPRGAALAGRIALNVNSTAHGGGVAEMLQTLLAYARGAGVDARWVVIEGDPAFFAVTKRIHNGIYGSPGDGGDLGPAERGAYERTLERNASELLALVRPRRHRAAARPADRRAGRPRSGGPARRVVWRCHIGADAPERVDHARVGLPAALRRAGRRLRLPPRRLRAAVARRRPSPRHPAVDRPVLGQERADVRPQRARRARATSGSSTATGRCPWSPSAAATARRVASTTASTSCRPGRRRRATPRSSSRSRAGTP